MSGGEGGCWDTWDIRLANEFYQLVSRKPLMAFEILTLVKVLELGGLPLVKITLYNGVIIEGDFDGVIFEKGKFKLDLHIPHKESMEINVNEVKNIFVIDQDSSQITEEGIARSMALDLEIEKYYRDQNANKRGDTSGGGGPCTSKVFTREGGNN